MKKWTKNSNTPTVGEFIEMPRARDVTFLCVLNHDGVMGVEASDLIEGCDVATRPSH